MALFKYFQRSDSVLPKPEGPLSAVVPASGIKAANAEVKPVLEAGASKRGTYDHFSPQDKARIGKRASLRRFLNRVW